MKTTHRIYKPDGSNSLAITKGEFYIVQVMLALREFDFLDATKMIPEDYKIVLQNRAIPISEITLDKPTTSELKLDF